MRVLGTARRSNQSVLKKINPGRTDVEYSLEGLMLKLKLQYFHRLMQRAHSLEETLMLRKADSKRRRGRVRQIDHHLNGHEFEQTSRDSEG